MGIVIPKSFFDEIPKSGSHNRKAIISEDGHSITFMYAGKTWEATSHGAISGQWFVKGPEGLEGFGWTIWAAVDDARFYMGKKEK